MALWALPMFCSVTEVQSTAFDGANQLRVGEDEIFAPDRAVGSHTAVQGNDAWAM